MKIVAAAAEVDPLHYNHSSAQNLVQNFNSQSHSGSVNQPSSLIKKWLHGISLVRYLHSAAPL
ncbi:hypothetical protein ACTXT7_002366 [Hymenolepis weldensis]